MVCIGVDGFMRVLLTVVWVGDCGVELGRGCVPRCSGLPGMLQDVKPIVREWCGCFGSKNGGLYGQFFSGNSRFSESLYWEMNE